MDFSNVSKLFLFSIILCISKRKGGDHMTIQFLDLRLSQHSNSDAATTPIPTAPASLLFGDIGIQTAGVSLANAGDIRVLLNGYVKVSGLTLAVETLTIRVFRDTGGGPVQIFVTTYGPVAATLQETWGFSVADFPPAPLSGEIQYTATIETDLALVSTAVIGAANFSGTAAAGTTTS
jgi:hypothetical protein